jgi:hypothetical protein
MSEEGRKLKKEIREYGPVQRPSEKQASMFRITKPVGYEERVHLAWAETDAQLRRMARDAWIDENEEEALLYMVLWNLDTLSPYWDKLEDFEKRRREAFNAPSTQEKIRLYHRLCEALMDQVRMALQRGMQQMDSGFGEDEDSGEVMRDPLELD